MQNEDDLRSLAKIMDFGRAVSIFLLTVHVYVYCYPTLEHFHLTLGVIDRKSRGAGFLRRLFPEPPCFSSTGGYWTCRCRIRQ